MGNVVINDYIIADPEICHGKPVFKGTRVMVWQILDLLEAGESPGKIYKAYPGLPKGAVEAALRYATERVKGISYVPFSKSGSLGVQILT